MSLAIPQVPGVTLPVTDRALAVPAPQLARAVGQIVQAQVMALLTSGGAQVQVGGQAVDLPAAMVAKAAAQTGQMPQAGQSLDLRVAASSQGPVLTLARPATPTTIAQQAVSAARPSQVAAPTQAALSQVVSAARVDAVLTQADPAQAFADLARLDTPQAPRAMAALPAPARQAVLQLAGLVVDADAPPDTAALRQVMQAMGRAPDPAVSQAARNPDPVALAALAALVLRPQAQGAAPAKPAGAADLLTLLKTVLNLSSEAPAEQEAKAPPPFAPRPAQVAEPPKPVLRDNLPLPQKPALPTLPAEIDIKALTRHLAELADGLKSRVMLNQLAALPDEPARGDTRTEAPMPQWHLELPVSRDGHLSMIQMRIDREAGRDSDEGGSSWRVRFAMDIEPVGPVQADIALRQGAVRVVLAAARETTRALFRMGRDDLARALRDADLTIDEMSVRAFTPAAAPAANGQIADLRT
jgi:hypothetical protein